MDGENVLVFDDGGKIGAVVAEGDGFAVRVGYGEGVREVEEGFGRNLFEKAGRAREPELIPAHVGEFDRRGERANASREEIQALQFGGFFAGFEEDLETEADSEEGNAAMESINERSANTLLIEGAD